MTSILRLLDMVSQKSGLSNVSSFFDIVSVKKDETSDVIGQMVKIVLNKWNVNKDQVISLTTDGANKM